MNNRATNNTPKKVTSVIERTNQKGMTLIEIMVVLVIIGILGTILVPRLLDRPDQARVVKAKQDIKAFEGALSLYRLDNFTYPDSLQALAGRYMDRVPNDPWGNAYQYTTPGTNGGFDILSYGADGQAGGDGVNADISNNGND